jgi:hypothetical protein
MTGGWEILARWPGGTVSALAVVPGADGLVLAATAAGLHVSEDGGQSWRWVGLGPDPVIETVAVSAALSTDRTVLLGTGSGLYRSTDGGKDWRHVLAGSRAQCIGATPDFADGGVVLAGTESDGLLRSEDGGLTWAGVSAGLLDLNVTAVALSPAMNRDRTAFAGTASGLYRSRNGGRAWRLVELGPEAPAIQAIAVSPNFDEDGLVLAGTESDGLFRSADSGQTWEPVQGFPEPSVTSLAFGAGAGSPTSAGSLLAVAGTAAGVAVSRDGGHSWTIDAPEIGPILALEVVGGSVLAGTVGAGVMRWSLDEGGWQPANQGLAGRATVDLAVSTAYGTVPLIAVASLDAGVMLSHDAGASWTTGHDGLESLAATSVAFARTLAGQPRLSATIGGRAYWSEDIETGWQTIGLQMGQTARASVLASGGDTTRATSTVLAAGHDCLALSVDGGATWQALSLPSPHAEVVDAAASPFVERDRTVYVVTRAARVTADGSLEADGLELWQTADLGRHWSRWLHAPTASVMALAVPPAGAFDASLLVGYDGRVARPLRSAQEVRRGERRPLWQESQIGDSGSAVTTLALSPRAGRDRIVLAAADDGVYLSQDGGATFSAWDDGLHVPLVTALAVAAHGDGKLIAYALGLGGTLWQRRL